MSVSSFETMRAGDCDGVVRGGGSGPEVRNAMSLQVVTGLLSLREVLSAGGDSALVVRGTELIFEGEGDARI